jgi:hypothetical protein
MATNAKEYQFLYVPENNRLICLPIDWEGETPKESIDIRWGEFTDIALKSMANEFLNDSELISVLRARDLSANTDKMGCPLPGSGIIHYHPEPENFRWIVNFRRSTSLEESNQEYVRYADGVLEFFKLHAPFSKANPLFIISILTQKDKYKFLFAPLKDALSVFRVRHLNELRKLAKD